MTDPKAAFAEHCTELLGSVGPVRAKRMFGGYGLYAGELFFALIAGETLYLKADAQTLEAFRAAGCEPFVYDARERRIAMSYQSAPAEAMESPALMAPWARRALEAALRAAALKRKPKASASAPGAAPARRATSARAPKRSR